MRYEDASGAFQASGPIANDDADTLSAGQRGPATGNLISGEGTQYGSAGADSAAGGHITAIAGKGGEDSSFAGGKLSVEGEHGKLTVDADGNYSYLANANAENVRDRFTYTLADNAGNSDTAALIVEIGKTPAVIKANAQQIVPGPDGVVTLPAGVDLSDVHVVGRNLVVDLPDGTQLVIIDGAVFVPQLQLGGVEVPATNVAALLVGQEVQPAAGELPPSSGGNFALPPPPLDPGIPLGDLIPPTEYNYIPPEPEEVFDIVDEEPEIFIQPDGQPASVNAVDSVDEKGLPTRNGGEPEGSGEEAAAGADGDTSEATAGTIIIDSPDGVDSVTINGVLVTGAIGQEIDGDFGTLTITGFDGDNILYSYVLNDNTSGNDTHDDFSVTLTDEDGDQATATLVIDIIDDVPTARPDTDAIAAGQYGPVTGNVITDASAGDADDGDNGRDTVGADDADLTAITGFGSTTPSEGGFTVNGQYGVLTISTDGSYSYTRNPGTPGGVQDVFNYTLTDGDGDTSTTTLTITIGDATPETRPNPVAQLDDDALAGGNPGGVGDDPNSVDVSGNLLGVGGDGPLTFNVLLTGAPAGFSYVSGGAGVVLVQQGGVTVLTVTVDSTTGAYTIVQNAPIDHPAGSDENNVQFTINYTVTDQDGDAANGTLGINVDDDTPTATNDIDSIAGGSSGPATGNVITGVDSPGGDANGTDGSADSVGADGGAAIVGLASNNVPANVDNNAAGGFVVDGEFGTLTMQADGSYSYVRADGTPGEFQDVFTYTLTDGDGDTTTATLTIDISDNAPQLATPTPVQLDDDALAGGNPGGTGDDPNSSGTPGQLNGSGGDGDLDYFFTGSNTLPAGFSVNVVNDGQIQILQGATVVLTVTLNNETGAYTVVQNNPIDHVAGSNENNYSFNIGVNVEDADGDSASSGISINVDDDTPLANNDSDTVSGGTAVGNVITGSGTTEGTGNADSPGADGFDAITQVASNNVPANSDSNPSGGFTVQGEYGSLQMDANGGYTYTRGANTPGGVSDVFTYTYRDGDGDLVSATLTINIPDLTPTLPDPAAVLLDDDALAGGNPGGTGDDVDSSGTPGQLNGSGGDGDLDYNFTGLDTLPAGFSVNVVNDGQIQILQGATVVLTVTLNNETGAYTVVQNNPIDHLAGSNENNYVFSIGVEVEDVDGDVEPATITINVDDDTPTAENDVDSIAGGSDDPATGNVITGVDSPGGDANGTDGVADSVGADGGAAIVGLASNNVPANVDNNAAGGFVVDGEFGTLTMQSDGSYSYVRADGSPGNAVDVFTYTLTDADGDTTTATLTISIGDAAPVLPDPALVRLDDDALANGNPGGTGDDVDSAGLPGQLAGSGGDGDLDYNFTGLNTLPAGFTANPVDASTVQILQGATVVLTITLNNDTGAFNVVQNNPIDHLAGSDENNFVFQVGVEVEDADGDVEPATITINVDDDTPVLSNVQAGDDVTLDETSAGTPAGFPINATSDTAVITATQAFGADGAAAVNSVVYGLAIVGGSPEPSGLATAIGDFPITLVQIDGDTIQGQYTDGGTQVAFTIQMNANGTVTLTQNVPLEHLVDGAPGAPHNDALDLDGLINATITITDGDGDSTSASAPIGDNLVFLDDGPDAQVDGQATLDQLVVDETRPLGSETDGDSNPVGVASVQANFANNFVAPVDYGADGAGTTSYSLSLSGNGIGSGLYALDPTDTETVIDGFGQGAEITLSINGAGTLITGSAGGVDYFTISINPATGVVTFTQLANVWHADTGNDDDTSTLNTDAPANVQVVQTVTDSDGDFDTAAINVGQGVFHIEDDGPEFGDVTAVLDMANDGNPAQGDLVIDLGSDGPSSNNNVISVDNFQVSVNGVALDPTDFELVEGAETATTASYTFSFTYDTGSGGEQTANGTLVFNKADGTYTVDLDGPIQGFTILQTATGTLFQGYEFGTSTLDGSQPEISVTQIQGTPGDPQPDDLFVQFTSVAEPSSGTGDNAMEVTNWVPGDDNPPPVNGGGDDKAWGAGQIFNQTDSWVSTSNSANGVAGDTIQGGEVLDFNLVQGANPTGVLADPSTYGQASSMFLKFDGIGAQEDMIVILKLYDPNTDTYTTKALMIQNSDIQKGPGTGPGDYSGITLDNNDGLVIIESNDYNGAGENWVIVGAQIAGSDEGVTGTAINLNGAIGVNGDSDANNDGSLDTQAFSTDVNDGPFKISSIGFVTTQSSDQNASLDFDVTITEADGDSETQHITVNVGDTSETLAATSFASSSTSTKIAANDDYSSLYAAEGGQKYAGISSANVGNTGITSAMVAASGLAAMATTFQQSLSQPSLDSMAQDSFQQLSTQSAAKEVADEGLASISFGSQLNGHAVDAVNLSHASFNFGDFGSAGRGLEAASSHAEPADAPSYAAGEPAAANVPAFAVNVPAVSMASAAMLSGNGSEGVAENGGSVEQVLADALGSDAPTIDGVLANLPGGIAELAAISHLASPDGAGVPAWDMGMHGAFAQSHDMMFKVAAVIVHQDAVQPA